MIEIGGKPIIWHIMKIYSHRDQRLHHLPGLQGVVIKEYFQNYFLHMSDVTFDMATIRYEVHDDAAPSRGG